MAKQYVNTCANCGKEWVTVARSGSLTCRSCSARAMRKRGCAATNTINCAECGKTFRPKGDATKYCSRMCAWAEGQRGRLRRAGNGTRSGILAGITSIEQDRFWARVDKTTGNGPNGNCWLWTGRQDKYGYGYIALCRVNFRAHRVAYFLEHGVDLGDLRGCHRCDNPPCVNPADIFPGTTSENNADMVSKGRQSKGNRRPNVRFTPERIRAIRERYAVGDISQVALASEHGVKQGHIWCILNRVIWKHI